MESDPVFSFQDSRLVYTVNQNLYSWDISTGQTDQLTNFQKGNPPPRPLAAENGNAREKWLRQDQLNTFDVLKTRKMKRDFTDGLPDGRSWLPGPGSRTDEYKRMFKLFETTLK